MAINDIRLWHVTALWQRKDAHLKKEFVASAPTKEAALKSAQDRLPINIRKADGYKISARDLGTIKDNKIWFSSDVTSNAVIRIDDPSVTAELIDVFTILWGEEIGWRSTNQSATEKDKTILSILKKDKERRELLPVWADECLQFPEIDATEFFHQKLSEYIGADSQNIEDMIPVSDNEYDKLLSNAKSKANAIINEAKESADIIRTQLAAETANLAKIAAALTGQMSAWKLEQNHKEIVQPEPTNTKEPESQTDITELSDTIKHDEPENRETIIEEQPPITDEPIEEETTTINDEPSIDAENSLDTNESEELENQDDNDNIDVQPTPADNPSETEEITEPMDEPSDEIETSETDDFADDFPDFPEDDDSYEYDGESYDEDPPAEAFHQYQEEEFEPPFEELLGMDTDDTTADDESEVETDMDETPSNDIKIEEDSPDENNDSGDDIKRSDEESAQETNDVHNEPTIDNNDSDEHKEKPKTTSENKPTVPVPLIEKPKVYRSVAEQKAYELLLSFKEKILLHALSDLTIKVIDKSKRVETQYPAKEIFYQCYTIPSNLSESDKVMHIVNFIKSCDDIDDFPSCIWVYNKYAIQLDDDTVFD